MGLLIIVLVIFGFTFIMLIGIFAYSRLTVIYERRKEENYRKNFYKKLFLDGYNIFRVLNENETLNVKDCAIKSVDYFIRFSLPFSISKNEGSEIFEISNEKLLNNTIPLLADFYARCTKKIIENQNKSIKQNISKFKSSRKNIPDHVLNKPKLDQNLALFLQRMDKPPILMLEHELIYLRNKAIKILSKEKKKEISTFYYMIVAERLEEDKIGWIDKI